MWSENGAPAWPSVVRPAAPVATLQRDDTAVHHAATSSASALIRCGLSTADDGHGCVFGRAQRAIAERDVGGAEAGDAAQHHARGDTAVVEQGEHVLGEESSVAAFAFGEVGGQGQDLAGVIGSLKGPQTSVPATPRTAPARRRPRYCLRQTRLGALRQAVASRTSRWRTWYTTRRRRCRPAARRVGNARPAKKPRSSAPLMLTASVPTETGATPAGTPRGRRRTA